MCQPFLQQREKPISAASKAAGNWENPGPLLPGKEQYRVFSVSSHYRGSIDKMCAAFEGAQCDNERTWGRQNKEGGEKRTGGELNGNEGASQRQEDRNKKKNILITANGLIKINHHCHIHHFLSALSELWYQDWRKQSKTSLTFALTATLWYRHAYFSPPLSQIRLWSTERLEDARSHTGDHVVLRTGQFPSSLSISERSRELKNLRSQNDGMYYRCSEHPGGKTNAAQNKAMKLALFLLYLVLYCIGYENMKQSRKRNHW